MLQILSTSIALSQRLTRPSPWSGKTAAKAAVSEVLRICSIRRRLARAHRMLSEPQSVQRQLSAIAYDA